MMRTKLTMQPPKAKLSTVTTRPVPKQGPKPQQTVRALKFALRQRLHEMKKYVETGAGSGRADTSDAKGYPN